MLAADRRTILVLKADTEPVETLTIPRTSRARMRVASSSSVTPEVVHRLGRRVPGRCLQALDRSVPCGRGPV